MRVVLCVFIIFALAVSASDSSSLRLLHDFQGIEFTQQGRAVGMPLGGYGAGCLEINSQGRLAEFANVNNWAARIPSIAGTGLWLTYTAGGVTKVYPLSEGQVRFEGNFPFAKLQFPDLPVDLTLWCWSPFILHDARRSGYPAAIFDAEVKNTSKDDAEIGLVLSYGTSLKEWFQGLSSGRTDKIDVDTDSVSSAFVSKSASGISFSTKSVFDAESLEKKSAAVRKSLEDSYMRAYAYWPLDITPACNRSYLHSPFGSDAGNAPLDFGDLQPGKRLVYGVPFVIIDDQAADAKSLVMAGPPAAVNSVTVPVDRRADCLFFLGNVAGWANLQGSSAEYVVHYSDGTSSIVPLRNGFEFSDWMGGAAVYSPAQITGTNSKGGAYAINVFAIPTDGSKTTQSVELKAAGGVAPMIFAITTGTLAEIPLAEGIVAMRRVDVDRMSGNVESGRLISNTDAQFVLAARHLKGTRVLTHGAGDPDSLKSALSGASGAGAKPTVYAVEQRIKLARGKSGELGLICSWYAPNHRDMGGYRFGHKYEAWFKDAGAVAEEIAAKHDHLVTATKKHYDLVARTTLPKWYREMVQSNFYLMPATSWWTKDDITFLYETPNGCPLFGTMDVRYYGSFQKLAAFPEMDAQVLRQFAGVQSPDGFITHDLGNSNGIVDTYRFPSKDVAETQPSNNRHDYDGFWVNLPIKFCLEVARHYQWTGDRAFLAEMWPHVKRAIVWIKAQDEDNDGLPETNYGYDGWKMKDKCDYDANQWLAMLVAVARCADDLGERQYASDLRDIHKNALAQVEKLLWTGKYYRQAVHNDTGNNDMVSLLQVAGDWYADILGIDDGLPREHVRSALKTIDEVNGKDAIYGATDCLFPDGSRNDSWISIGQAIGWQYFYASHCMYEGLDDIALRIADETWRQFTVEKARIPWCQEEFIADPRKGECPYWLLRDSRMGSAMVMSYAAAGLQMDVPRKSAEIRPAEWVWKADRIILPVLLPKWLGQINYRRQTRTETYYLTNLEKPIKLESLKLRTCWPGATQITIGHKTRQVDVGADGMVDVGPVMLSGKVTVKLTPAR